MSLLRKDSEIRLFWLVGLLFSAVYLLVYIFEIGGYTGLTWISDLVAILIAWLIVFFVFRLWQGYTSEEVAKTNWGLLLVGFILWAMGETIWAFYELVLQQDIPYPSLADIMWVIGYIPLFAGLWRRYRTTRAPYTTGFWLAVIVFIFVLLVVFYFILWPIITYTEYERNVEKALDIFYPAGDLLLLFSALVIVFTLQGGRLALPWLIIAVGLATASFADLLFSYASWNELYFPDQHVNLITILTDVPYTVADLIIALGAFVQARLEGLF